MGPFSKILHAYLVKREVFVKIHRTFCPDGSGPGIPRHHCGKATCRHTFCANPNSGAVFARRARVWLVGTELPLDDSPGVGIRESALESGDRLRVLEVCCFRFSHHNCGLDDHTSIREAVNDYRHPSDAKPGERYTSTIVDVNNCTALCRQCRFRCLRLLRFDSVPQLPRNGNRGFHPNGASAC